MNGVTNNWHWLKNKVGVDIFLDETFAFVVEIMYSIVYFIKNFKVFWWFYFLVGFTWSEIYSTGIISCNFIFFSVISLWICPLLRKLQFKYGYAWVSLCRWTQGQTEQPNSYIVIILGLGYGKILKVKAFKSQLQNFFHCDNNA